jgi:hypothetical protein
MFVCVQSQQLRQYAYQWRNKFNATAKRIVTQAVTKHSSQVIERAKFAKDAIEDGLSQFAFYEVPKKVSNCAFGK